MAKIIKYNGLFTKKKFISFFINNTGNLISSLRLIDKKILKYLLNLDIGFCSLLDYIFSDLLSGLASVTVLEIMKLYFKKKHYLHLVPIDLQNNLMNSLNDLKDILLRNKTSISVVLGFLDFFFSIRTNRLRIKKYSKFIPLFSTLFLEENFEGLKVLFSNELKIYCKNCYKNLKLNFLNSNVSSVKNDLVIVQSIPNEVLILNKDIINKDIINNDLIIVQSIPNEVLILNKDIINNDLQKAILKYEFLIKRNTPKFIIEYLKNYKHNLFEIKFNIDKLKEQYLKFVHKDKNVMFFDLSSFFSNLRIVLSSIEKYQYFLLNEFTFEQCLTIFERHSIKFSPEDSSFIKSYFFETFTNSSFILKLISHILNFINSFSVQSCFIDYKEYVQLIKNDSKMVLRDRYFEYLDAFVSKNENVDSYDHIDFIKKNYEDSNEIITIFSLFTEINSNITQIFKDYLVGFDLYSFAIYDDIIDILILY